MVTLPLNHLKQPPVQLGAISMIALVGGKTICGLGMQHATAVRKRGWCPRRNSSASIVLINLGELRGRGFIALLNHK